MQKKVNAKWVPADFGNVLGCPGQSLERGSTLRDTLIVFTSNLIEQLKGVSPLDGVYRLRWPFVEGPNSQAMRARKMEALSNEFRMSAPWRAQ
jgi:hypothetical protein